MRILCDQNVPAKYVDAFQSTDSLIVTTVKDALQHDATDTEIAAYAEQNQWVVFTNDDDFFIAGGDHGLLLYDQLEDPRPGDIVQAVQRIEQTYTDPNDIVESIPGKWV